MNLFTAILDGAVAFVRRNPLFCLLILMLALFAPSVLGGIAMFVLYFILGIILLVVVLMLVFRWRIYRLRQQVEEQFRQGGGPSAGAPSGGRAAGREGEVKVYKTRAAAGKRVSSRVGDYVEFEEVETESEEEDNR